MKINTIQQSFYSEYEVYFNYLNNYFSIFNEALKKSYQVINKSNPPVLKLRRCEQLNKDFIDYLFYCLEIHVYEDHSADEIPSNGIKKSDYVKVKKVLNDIINNNSNIQFQNLDTQSGKNFKNIIFFDLLILMTIPSGRSLIFTLVERGKPVVFKEAASSFVNREAIHLDTKFFLTKIVRSDSNETFLCPSPRFITIGHELIHLDNQQKNLIAQSNRKKIEIEGFSDLEEMRTITGDSGDYIELIESCENIYERSISENDMRKEFKLPPRNDHKGDEFFSWETSTQTEILQLAFKYCATLNIKTYFYQYSLDKIISVFFPKEMQSEAFIQEAGRFLSFKFLNKEIYEMLQIKFKKMICKRIKNKFDSEFLLDAAVKLKLPQIVDWLLEENAKTNVRDQYDQAKIQTAIETAISIGEIEIVKIFLKHDCNIHDTNDEGQTLLHQNFLLNPKIAELLINQGIKKDSQDNSGYTPLHWAVIRGDNELIQILLDAGCSYGILDNTKKTSLDYALSFWNGVKLFIEAGISKDFRDFKGNTLAHLAVLESDLSNLYLVLEKMHPADQVNTEGKFPIHYAAEIAKEDFITPLIENNADVNCQDKEGNTALHLAILKQNPTAMKILISNRARLDITNQSGKTAQNLLDTSNLA